MPITHETPRGTLAYRTTREGASNRPGEFVVLLNSDPDDHTDGFTEGLRFKHPEFPPHSSTARVGIYYNDWLREIVDERPEV